MHAVATNGTVEIHDNGAENAVPGWSARQLNLTFKNVAYEEIAQLLPRLETNRPPWRITAIVIHAGQREGQAQEISLNLEMLERRGTGL